jgi:hypothetical protein
VFVKSNVVGLAPGFFHHGKRVDLIEILVLECACSSCSCKHFGQKNFVKSLLISTLDKVIYYIGTFLQGSTKPLSNSQNREETSWKKFARLFQYACSRSRFLRRTCTWPEFCSRALRDRCLESAFRTVFRPEMNTCVRTIIYLIWSAWPSRPLAKVLRV